MQYLALITHLSSGTYLCRNMYIPAHVYEHCLVPDDPCSTYMSKHILLFTYHAVPGNANSPELGRTPFGRNTSLLSALLLASIENGCTQVAGRRHAPIGPAAPPPELLAAAAQMPWEDDEEDVEDLIGPAPPEMAEELDGVGGDERIAEVARVIR